VRDGGAGQHGIDETLVQRARAGDDLAFAALARAVRPLVYRWALVQCTDADVAEDIAQRVLLRMHNSLAGFRGEAAFTTWLYTLVRSAAADWRRGERRRAAMLQRHASGNEHELAGAVADPAHDQALLQLVRRQLGSLPARQREVFDLVDLQGHAIQDVADMLSLADSTARVHLMRARRSIRERIIAQHPALLEERS
jgi:RNA polymerase sigma-70 factor (ECF subfamily)